jgi:hypothetical protein
VANDRVAFARILLELGELTSAEAEVVESLDERPDDLEALSLYAKIKHVRGELSHAIACWAQLHARSPHAERVRATLAALFRRASLPEHGAEPLLAIGSASDAEAFAELEHAFRLHAGLRPDAAHAACEALASRHRDDRERYKLAVLASAWLAELGGRHDLAARRLEALGCERGFEDDADRLLALVRAYERVGTRAALASAARLCAHLEARFERLSLAGRLAAIHRRLGDVERARVHDERDHEGFRRRMHLPSVDDVVRIAARRHLPLGRLREVRVSTTAARDDLSERERAIRDVLGGSFDRAREAFSRGRTVLDRHYRAEVAHLAGDVEAAARDYVDVARSEEADLHVYGWLLDHLARAPEHAKAKAIDALLREPAIAERARRKIEGAIRDDPRSPAAWRWRATLLSLEADGEDARLRAARSHADAVAAEAERAENPIGRVHAAGVYRFADETKGLIHQLWADREATVPGLGGALSSESILGNVTDEMRRSVRNVFLAVREYARAKFPHRTRDVLDFHYSFKVTKEDEPSGGLSAGLPTALAFLSVFLQRPLPRHVASTGVIVSDAHDVLNVRPVGDVAAKVLGAYEANLRLLLLPSGNRAALAESPLVPAAIGDEIVRFVSTFDEAVTLLFGEECFTAD